MQRMLILGCLWCCLALWSCNGDADDNDDTTPDTLVTTPLPPDAPADVRAMMITVDNEEKVGFYVDYSEQLSDEERRLYRSAALRASMQAMKNNDTALPLFGKTVGQVIADERAYQERHGETASELLDRMERNTAGTAGDDSVHTPRYPNKPAGRQGD